MNENDIKKFLKDNKSLLESNNLNELYKEWGLYDRDLLTRFFISYHINPLNYMNNVPSNYDSHDPHLLEIEIPNNIITINEYAFLNCTHLREVIISDNVHIIGFNAFANCIKLKEVKLGYGIIQIIDSFDKCISLESINLPEGLEFISGEAFSGCDSLKELKLPKGLKSISLTSFPPKLNELVISQDTDLVISNINKRGAKYRSSILKYPITYKGVKYSDGIDFYNNVVEPLY